MMSTQPLAIEDLLNRRIRLRGHFVAGLFVKELRLRGVADRVLVLCAAPLTVQWQEEMHDKFDEQFEILDSRQVKWQLAGNPWQRHDRVITSLDFAKREEVMPDLLR